MANKVEISGIDTSKLPRLSHKDMMVLLEKAHAGDEAARDEFVIANMRLVLSVCQRFSGKRENMDDIFQVGCVGLIKAMDNFNTALNVRFSTYAVPMIIGEIRRFLRDNNSVRVSRSLRDIAYKALQAREQIEKATNEIPSINEIAAAIDMKPLDVASALDAISDPVSLFDPVYRDSGDTVMLMDQLKDEKNSDEVWIEHVALRQALGKLASREKEILYLRYFEGKTQMEVSEEVGISQAQVSRLEKTALSQIKGSLN